MRGGMLVRTLSRTNSNRTADGLQPESMQARQASLVRHVSLSRVMSQVPVNRQESGQMAAAAGWRTMSAARMAAPEATSLNSRHPLS
jgi:hypothetical protein